METPPQVPPDRTGPGAMDALHEAGIWAALTLQAGPPWLEQFWVYLTSHFDPKSIYTFCFPLAHGLDARVGLMVLWIGLVAEWLNVVLKWFLFGERPYWWIHESGLFSQEELEKLPLRQFPVTCETGPGSPSGHCMIPGAALWPLVTALTAEVARSTRRVGAGLGAAALPPQLPRVPVLRGGGCGTDAECTGPAQPGHGCWHRPRLVPPPGQRLVLGPGVAAARHAALRLAVPGGGQCPGAGPGRRDPPAPPGRGPAPGWPPAGGEHGAGPAGPAAGAQAAQALGRGRPVQARGRALRGRALPGGLRPAPVHHRPQELPGALPSPPSHQLGGLRPCFGLFSTS
ncbi:PREDICTED: glucose-6-phosphatase 3 isoform X3 [Lepidothrix coronata]|uniref:glucose-6-phosphatase n=1 Tax=Lepidothrix coronata TaxID=321398 RepID=A0A6J0J807_9PASS|nr:PREDICTED: glucose-6-phosphatase 3 isoform X3 [Lepidothrix coronata]